jgi:hypothetical protein
MLEQFELQNNTDPGQPEIGTVNFDHWCTSYVGPDQLIDLNNLLTVDRDGMLHPRTFLWHDC